MKNFWLVHSSTMYAFTGANLTTLSYNTSVVKKYSVTNSMVRVLNFKKISDIKAL
jgi:hypothetical protein